MKTLRETLADAAVRHIAVGHFNISDLLTLRAIVAAARELAVPVMIGVSEGERDFMGVRQVAALVQSMREEYQHPIYLNADHTHSLEAAEEAARAGFDEVIFDGSKLDFNENVARTKRAVESLRSINSDIVIEGEIGYIGSSSEVLAETPKGASLAPGELTTPEEAKRFVEATGVDVLAPAVGNMHGLLVSMVRGETRKRLDIERIRRIAAVVGKPLTLHGGSGTADEDLAAAIKAGITIVHINTELRVAWRQGVERGLAEHPNEVAPYKLLPPAFEAIERIVRERLALFGRM
jgi:fructose-bisphosphate aldolase, class II